MKQYQAVFFDWDGTAVRSRKAPADAAAQAMRGLLKKGVKLVIVSGTTYENIAGGRIEQYFTKEELSQLYLGLGRGAYNYRFEDGKPVIFRDSLPDREGLLKVHDICYAIHRRLLERYGYETDIIFTRPNYCKIDIMVDNNRGDSLFLQENEPESLREKLKAHGISGGLKELLRLAEDAGREYGVNVSATCDAKYLEVGVSDKSDNVNAILRELHEKYGIGAQECSFWGDEFVGLEEGIFGSDSFMKTEKTGAGDFFDVSEVKGERPEGVTVLGGGVDRFLEFLREQATG